MKLTLTGVGPDGAAKILVGEALPKTSRPILPTGIIVALSIEDFDRLKEAALRLHRAALASDAVGPANLTFDMDKGFIVPSPVPDLPVKALALESRPFFLNDDPLYFPALVKLQSFGAYPDIARAFRDHTKRWKESAFEGAMGIRFGKDKLDLDTVVRAWFNSDLFHTGPQRAEALTLDGLTKLLGGPEQARALLALHLISSLGVVNEFIKDVAGINLEFHTWLLETMGG